MDNKSEILLLALLVFCLFLALIIVYNSSAQNNYIVPLSASEITGTPTALAYLPVISKPLPTNTPTFTPTSAPTPRPNLQDGYYSGNAGYYGDVWFTVSNGGTSASNGGFYTQAFYFCSPGSYSFTGPVSITNGGFSFQVYDFQERILVASLSCTSISNAQATCKTYYQGLGSQCSHSSGLATLKYLLLKC
jgi:hypothetical protein